MLVFEVRPILRDVRLYVRKLVLALINAIRKNLE